MVCFLFLILSSFFITYFSIIQIWNYFFRFFFHIPAVRVPKLAETTVFLSMRHNHRRLPPLLFSDGIGDICAEAFRAVNWTKMQLLVCIPLLVVD